MGVEEASCLRVLGLGRYAVMGLEVQGVTLGEGTSGGTGHEGLRATDAEVGFYVRKHAHETSASQYHDEAEKYHCRFEPFDPIHILYFITLTTAGMLPRKQAKSDKIW